MKDNDLVRQLQALAARPAAVTRAQRVGPLLATAILPLAMVVYSFICLFPLVLARSSDQCVQDVGFARTEAYTDLKDDWEEDQNAPATHAERKAVRMVLASSYAQFKGSPHYAELKSSLSHRFFPLPEDELEAALKEFPTPSENELADARRTFEQAKKGKVAILVSLPLIMVGLYAVPALLLSFGAEDCFFIHSASRSSAEMAVRPVAFVVWPERRSSGCLGWRRSPSVWPVRLREAQDSLSA